MVEAADIQEITIDWGPCFGTCPIFTFTAKRSGTYDYFGEKYVKILGTRTGDFPLKWFEPLASACLDNSILSMEDRFVSCIDDFPSLLVAIHHTSGTKKVIDGGGGGPKALWGFARLVEQMMKRQFNIEDLKQQGMKKRER